ncbi:metallophosphoesterase [Candidatus Woesearchaeota archaeon]|nr:metallophosphoesterase [Candidatus Woesearchaeota archaeon]
MKMLAVGDLHGQIPVITFKEFDAIILPGDFCSDRGKEYIWKAMKWNAKNPKKEKKWWSFCGKKNAEKIILQNINSGRKVLEKLSKYNKPIFVVPGNWDYTGEAKGRALRGWKIQETNFYEKIINEFPLVIDCFRKSYNYDNYKIVGNGIMSAPERRGAQYGYEYWRKPLEKHFKNAKKKRKPIIYLNHDIPYMCMDQITNKNSPAYGKHYGSKVARDLIIEYKPAICIGGHIHEHYGTKRIGKTIVLNTGFGGDKNTLITLEKGKVANIEYATNPWSGKVKI